MLILCVLNCNTVYSTSNTTDFKFPEITVLSLIILLILEVKYLTKTIMTKWIVCFLPYFIWNIIVIVFSVSADKLISYIVRFMLFIPLLSLIIMIHRRKGTLWKVFIHFKDLICIYAIISIALWLLTSFFNAIPPTSYMECNWGTVYNYPLYFGIYTMRQTQEFLGINWIRNIGIFTEGPMYNLVLLLAITVEMFISPLEKEEDEGFFSGVDIKKLIILVFADITTFTTTGFILMIGIFALKYILIKNKTTTGKLVKWFVGILVIIMAFYMMSTLFLEKSTSGSWEVRADDLRAGIATWSENLLLGTGYDSMKSIEAHMSSFRFYNMGYSSGLFSVLAQGGILLFLNYFFGFCGYVIRAIKLRQYELIAMLAIFTIIFITAIFQNTFLMMLFLAYGYAFLPKINENKKVIVN